MEYRAWYAYILWALCPLLYARIIQDLDISPPIHKLSRVLVIYRKIYSGKNATDNRTPWKLNNTKTLKINIDIRFRDLDALGHVNNSVYFTYFEEGRKILFRNIFGDNSFRFILAHASCDYINPAALNDQLTLFMKVGKIGTKSFELQYEVTDRNDTATVFAKGESVQVCFDYERNESIPISDALKDKLLEY